MTINIPTKVPQKPYISRVGRDWVVLDCWGRGHFVTQSELEAQCFFNAEYDALLAGSLPIKGANR